MSPNEPAKQRIINGNKRWAFFGGAKPEFLKGLIYPYRGFSDTLALPLRSEQHTEFFDERRYVLHRGKYPKFDEKQWRIVRVLRDAHQRGAPDMPEQLILDRAGVETRLRELFKRHPSWGTLIVRTKPGRYRLSLS